MKTRLLLVIAALVAAAFPVLAEEQAAEKGYLYYINLYAEKSPVVAAQKERVERAKWQKLSYLGAMLPQVALNHTRNYSTEGSISETGWETSLSARQVLFTGGTALNTLLMAGSNEAAEEYALSDTKIAAYEQAAAAYFKCAALELALAASKEDIATMENRVSELSRRENLGKSRTSEVYAAKSRLHSLKSSALQTELDYKNALQDFVTASGEQPQQFVIPEAGAAVPVTDEETAKMAARHPFVKSMEEKLTAYERASAAEKGSFLPSVSLAGSYGVAGSDFVQKNPSISLVAEWDVFRGGSRLAESAAAEALVSQARADLQNARNTIKAKVAKAANNYYYSAAKLSELKEAADMAAKSLKEQQRDYSYGNVTNLEVLQAMSDASAGRTAFDNGRAEAAKTAFILWLYSGEQK